ncbi:MAG: protein kinase, partial [Pseudomonadota bacterium]
MADTRETGPLEFHRLDELLDQALSLGAEERDAWLAELPAIHRSQLEDLLQRTEADDLQPLAAAARQLSESHAAKAVVEPPGQPGSWRLQELIGTGGMGQVWLAVREAQDFAQTAAIKMLKAQRSGQDLLDRFLRERRILASLQHPGIARFLDAGVLDDGSPWFAMDYVAGQSLLGAAAGLSLTAKIDLFLKVCDAVAYAHNRLVIHRDIKPANILVDEEGQPRLLDFGVAALLEDRGDAYQTGQAGSPITLQYASPEQVSDADVTVASDVYQLGLLLYELLAERPPYRLGDLSLEQALETLTQKAPPPPSHHQLQRPQDLDAVVLKALQKDPVDRYEQVAMLAADLRNYLGGFPVAARPPSPWYLAKRFVQRHATLVTLGALFAVGLTLATSVAVNRSREANAQAERSAKAQEILASVFRQADPYREGQSNIGLADALRQARSSMDEQVRGDPLLATEVYLALGETYAKLGLTDEERDAYQQAYDASQNLPASARRLSLSAVNGLGNALVRDDPAEAERFLRESLPDRPLNKRESQTWLKASYALANAYLRLRQMDRADDTVRSMAEVAERYGQESARSRGQLSQLLAGVALRAGDREGADGHWRQAVAHMRETENPFPLAVMLSNQGIFLGQGGRIDESDAAFQESLGIFRRHSPSDPTHASVLRTYSGLLIRTGRYSEAVDRLQHARRIVEPTSEHYTRYVVLVNLARAAFLARQSATSVEAAVAGMTLALERYGGEAEISQRMRLQLARLLSFAELHSEGLRLLLPVAKREQPSRDLLVELADIALDDAKPATARWALNQLEPAKTARQRRVLLRTRVLSGQPLPTWEEFECGPSPAPYPDAFTVALRRWYFVLNAPTGPAAEQAVNTHTHPLFDPLD